MKNKRNRRTYSAPTTRRYAYPGAAEPRYFAEKLQQGIAALATGMSAVTVFFLLILMYPYSPELLRYRATRPFSSRSLS